jgi:hypothetical protein
LYARLLGIGIIYGLGFTLIKSLFPTPVILFFTGGESSEGNLAVLASVYLASGLIAGVIGGPVFGALLLRLAPTSSVSCPPVGSSTPYGLSVAPTSRPATRSS